MRDVGDNKRVIRTEKKSCGCSKNRRVTNTYKLIKEKTELKKKQLQQQQKNKKIFL